LRSRRSPERRCGAHARRHGKGLARCSRRLRTPHRRAAAPPSRTLSRSARSGHVGSRCSSHRGTANREGGGMIEDDPFDVEKLRIEPAETWATIPKKIARRRDRFIMVPGLWKEQLTKATLVSTYKLALHLLARDFETHGQPFTLSNGALALEGVSRW